MNIEEKKTFIINRISQLRIRHNLSARALSQRIDMNDGYINRLESKKDFLPSVEVLLKIMDVCNIDIEEFFCKDLDEYELDKELLGLLRGLSKEKKEAIFVLLKN